MEPLILPLLIELDFTSKDHIPLTPVLLEEVFLVVSDPVVVAFHLADDVVELVVLLAEGLLLEAGGGSSVADVFVFLSMLWLSYLSYSRSLVFCRSASISFYL
jgi:hypothetical protein